MIGKWLVRVEVVGLEVYVEMGIGSSGIIKDFFISKMLYSKEGIKINGDGVKL